MESGVIGVPIINAQGLAVTMVVAQEEEIVTNHLRSMVENTVLEIS